METLESSILIPQGKKKWKETKQNKNILRVGGKCFVALLRAIPCGVNMNLKGTQLANSTNEVWKSSKMAAHNFASRYDDSLSLLPTRGFTLYISKKNKKPVIGAKDCDDFHSFHDDRRCPCEVWYLFIGKLWLFFHGGTSTHFAIHNWHVWGWFCSAKGPNDLTSWPLTKVRSWIWCFSFIVFYPLSPVDEILWRARYRLRVFWGSQY